MEFHVATVEDAKFLFELRNLESNRVQFRNPDVLEWESHFLWIGKFFLNQKNRLYIFSFQGERVGMFKVDFSGDVGISLIDKFKGRGFGSEMIKIGSSQYLHDFPSAKIFAEIKKENVASFRAFEKAGYKLLENTNSDYLLMNFAGENENRKI